MRAPLALVLLLALPACDDDGDAAGPEETAAATTTAAALVAPPALGEDPEPVVIGHRGAAGHHPDNSLEGFAAARALGATWVELDVRLSSDGDVYLSHDPETAAGSVVAETPSTDLAAEGLPTLDEALEVIDEHALGVDIELKSLPWEEGYDPSLALVDTTVGVVEARESAGPVVFSSFNLAAIDRVLELTDDAYDTTFITSGLSGAEDLAGSLVAAGHDGVAIGDPDLTASDVAAFTAADLPVWSWTIDEPDVAVELVDRGVAGVITDVPDAISEALTR